MLAKFSDSDPSFRSSLTLQILFPLFYVSLTLVPSFVLGMGEGGRPFSLDPWASVGPGQPVLVFALPQAPALGRPAVIPGPTCPVARSLASCKLYSSAAFPRKDLPFSLSASSRAVLGVPSSQHVGVGY